MKFTEVLSKLGMVLIVAGMVCLRLSHGGSLFITSLIALGAGGLLLFLPQLMLTFDLSKVEKDAPGAPGEADREIDKFINDTRTDYIAALVLFTGLISLWFSSGGTNPWTIGSVLLTLSSAVIYLWGKMRTGNAAVVRGNAICVVVGSLSGVAGMLCIVTLIIQLSGASDMPTRWNIYSFLGAAGLLAAMAGLWYAFKYQTNEEIIEMLAPLGFVTADSGLFGADGEYDAKGTLNGIVVLVNLTQNEPDRNSPANFTLTVMCRAANPRGLRLLIHKGNFLNAPLGSPVGLKKIKSADWTDYSVSGGPEADALMVLPLLKKAGAAAFSDRSGFTRLLIEGNELKADFWLEGRPEASYAKLLVETVSSAAKTIN